MTSADLEARVASTADLHTIFQHEVQHHLTRRLNDYQLNHLDPDGAHVLVKREGLARHEAGSAIDHYRAEVILKFAGEDLPYVNFIDVPVLDWFTLRTVNEALRLAATYRTDGDTD